MELVIFARILCETCAYFAVSVFLGSAVFPVSVGLAPALALGALGSLCAFLRKYPHARFIGFGALVLPFLFAQNAGDAVLLIPPCVYVCRLCIVQKLRPDHVQFSGFFLRTLRLSPIWVVIVYVLSGTKAAGRMLLPFLLVYIVCGVFGLRALRLPPAEYGRPGYQAMNLAAMLCVCGGGLLLCASWVQSGFVWLLNGAYRLIAVPILMGLTYIAAGAMWLIGHNYDFEALHSQMGYWTQMNGGSTAPVQEMEIGPGFSPVLKAILLALLACVFLYAAYLVFLRLGKHGRNAEEGAKDGKSGLRETGQKQIRRTIFPMDTRLRVRYYYEKYLRLLKKDGIERLPGDTTRDIREKAGERYPGWAQEQLRAAYLPARYDEGEPVGPHTVRQAKTGYQAIKTAGRNARHEIDRRNDS